VGEVGDRAGPDASRPIGKASYALAFSLAAAALLLSPLDKAAAQGYAGPPAPATAAPGVGGGSQGFAGPPAPNTPAGGAPATNQGYAGPPPPTGAPGGAAGGTAGAPSLLIQPALDLTTEFTDNALQTTTNRQSDIIGIISPSLFVTDDSPSVTGVLDYNPQAIEHVNITSENQIIQNGLLNGTATIIPDHFFFDAHATALEASRTGEQGLNNPNQIPTTAATQTTAYSASPYFDFHLSTIGDVELRYTLSQTLFSGNTGAIASSVPGQSVGALSSSTENEWSARYTSGDLLSRLQLTGLADYQESTGSAITDFSHALVTVTGDYALSPIFDLIGMGGYENLEYPNETAAAGAVGVAGGFTGNYEGPTYQGGFKYHPREDRFVELTYGKSEGFDSFSGDASWALTALATLTGSYSTQTETEQQQLQQNLGLATQTAPGQTINSQTGLPLSLVNPNLPLQNEVTRTTNLNVGALFQGGQRNHYSVQLVRSQQTALSSAASSTTTSGVVGIYTRDMSPDMTGSFSAAYSATTTTAPGVISTTSESVTATLSFNYQLTDTLSGNASYAFSRQTQVGGIVLTDLLTVGLHKSF
jgi:uncharacterized protein (PEP-CTERM system associated)